MKKLLLEVLSRVGVGITSSKNLLALKSAQIELSNLKDYLNFQDHISNSIFSPNSVNRAVNLFSKSTAQIQQDLVALLVANFKPEGFFVEFGATDGKALSNTYLLEKSFNWNGILAEPGRKWLNALKTNRSAIIDTKCVWRVTGEKLEFNETVNAELSTLQMFSSSDMHAKIRRAGSRYFVETISLEDLLQTYNAPKFIDYLSVDTEGSEFEILNSFDFHKYTFGFITCEHNFTHSRQRVFELLTSNGYIRILEDLSQFDDWYVHSSLIKTESFI